jgi:short-subunit dehydrogenase
MGKADDGKSISMITHFKLKPIEGQVIVITGASSGIGLSTARLAVRLGARVVISSRSEEALAKIVAELKNEKGQLIHVAADVSKYSDVENLRDRTVEKFGGIDTWINNAGMTIYGSLLEVPLEEERKLFDVNFWGVRHGSRVAIPELARSGGVLINLGSDISGRALSQQGIYAATKHAVKAYTNVLRREMEQAKVPVTITLIRPSRINTPLAEHARNYLPKGALSPRPSVHHPDTVAEVILRCAEKPTREAFVGGKRYSIPFSSLWQR